jgi:elongation factor Tu
MDGAILVVAGSEGQMPQTREHLLLSRRIGLEKIVVYVNKCDLIDKEVQELVELEVRDLLDSFGFDGNNCPFIFGSAALAAAGDKSELGEGSIIRLLEALDNYVTLPERDTKSPFMMPIESSLTIPGRGTVIIGTVNRGTLTRKDNIELIGCGRSVQTVVTDIQMFGESIPNCSAGDHVGVLCRNLKTNQVERGMVLSLPKVLKMGNRFEASMYLLSREEGGRFRPISTRYVQQMFSQTWLVGARVDVPDEEGGLLVPGDHGTVHLTLNKPMIMSKGQQFVIRENHQTVATGIVTKELENVEIGKQLLGSLKLPYGNEGSNTSGEKKRDKK